MIASMEEQLNVLLAEREGNAELLQRGSQIITEQDNVIRDLKKRLDKRIKKK
jgi:predicted Rossmann fold nucleotide-binding protein DprA/Smf involved in DNA uptake